MKLKLVPGEEMKVEINDIRVTLLQIRDELRKINKLQEIQYDMYFKKDFMRFHKVEEEKKPDIKPKPKRGGRGRGKTWSPAEDALLRVCMRQNMSMEEKVKTFKDAGFNRTPGGIKRRGTRI